MNTPKKNYRPAEIPFQQLLKALLDVDTPFNPRYLYRLSDMTPEELAQIEAIWPDLPEWRRKALLEDIETLGESDTLLSFEALGRFAARDVAPEVRLPAVRMLQEYDEPHLIPLFLDLLHQDPIEAVRAAAATALGRFVYQGELEEIALEDLRVIEDALLEIVRSPEQPVLVSRRALESLGFSSRDEVPGLIQQAYDSGDKDWMASAIFAMGRSANARWRPQVLAMLESKLPALRMEAARAVGELELKEALPRLVELLEDPTENVRDACIWSLSQLGGGGVRDLLQRMFDQSEDEEEAEYLEAALDNLSFTEEMALLPILDISDSEEGDIDEAFYAGLEDELAEEDELEDDLSFDEDIND